MKNIHKKKNLLFKVSVQHTAVSLRITLDVLSGSNTLV